MGSHVHPILIPAKQGMKMRVMNWNIIEFEMIA